VGKDGDRRLALDDALHRTELGEELATMDPNFHGASSYEKRIEIESRKSSS
jgi:hypothetical protein